jgi:hypothetical protein
VDTLPAPAMDQLNTCGATPPCTVTEIEPLLPPKQFTFVAEIKCWISAGCATVTLAVAVQLFASVIVTVYIPAVRLFAVCVVCVGTVDQKYVTGATPLVTDTVAVPLLPPKQLTGVALAVAVGAGSADTPTIRNNVQPFASVTVTR